jgi:Phytanoyl-CoA dioxygenase (PhyH)
VRTLDERFESDGFMILHDLVAPALCDQLAMELAPLEHAGRRGVLRLPRVNQWARSANLNECLRPHFDDEPFPVRAIYFNKTAQANWSVGWHQDLAIAVQLHHEVPGFGSWSVKDNVPHVQPPADILAKMLTVRLHLDDTDQTNGALRVLPGSHRFGRLAAEQIEDLQRMRPGVICSVSAGAILLMRPLLLHASSRASNPSQRRVLHIEYAAQRLPGGLEWHDGT